MNYDPESREVSGSVDHTWDRNNPGRTSMDSNIGPGVPTAAYVGCCGYVHDHTIHHGSDCQCINRSVAVIPDVEGRDVVAPQELSQVTSYGIGPVEVVRRVALDPHHSSYADADDNYHPPSTEDVDRRIAERSMWALEEIAKSLNALLGIIQADDQR